MKYNLMERINKENEKHILQLAEGKEFKINNSPAAIISMQAISKKNTESGEDDLDNLYEMIKIGIGEEGVKFVKDNNFTLQALTTIVSVITAAINGQTLEEFEAENLEDKSPS